MISYALADCIISTLFRVSISRSVDTREPDFGPSKPQQTYSPQNPHALQALRIRSDQISSGVCFQKSGRSLPQTASASLIASRVLKSRAGLLPFFDVSFLFETIPLGSGATCHLHFSKPRATYSPTGVRGIAGQGNSNFG